MRRPHIARQLRSGQVGMNDLDELLGRLRTGIVIRGSRIDDMLADVILKTSLRHRRRKIDYAHDPLGVTMIRLG